MGVELNGRVIVWDVKPCIQSPALGKKIQELHSMQEKWARKPMSQHVTHCKREVRRKERSELGRPTRALANPRRLPSKGSFTPPDCL